MRLIGTLATEKEAYSLYSFLLKEKIQNIYEPCLEEKTGVKQFRIWIYNEDDLEKAMGLLKLYKENPGDPQFQGVGAPPASGPPTPNYSEIAESEDLKWQTVPSSRVKQRKFSFTLTNLIIVLCAFLFLWNDVQKAQIAKEKGMIAEQIGLTPMEQNLFFDYPSSYQYIEEMVDKVPLNSYKEMKDLPPEAIAYLNQAENVPSWRGIYFFFQTAKNKGWRDALSLPMFEKIKQGEVWRFFSPCLMHANFLHILFNMVWVWILCRQIEQRMQKWKLCVLIVIIGCLANLAQYLVSGPYFLGFSGVVVGMAGFIWVRQKRAPWEGYPLEKGTRLFLLFFVLAMCAIELFTFGLQLFSVIQVSPQIANTAHVVGGLVGIFLGRFSFFARRVP